MKKLILTPVLTLLFLWSSVLTAQNRPEEYLGLPGDNLNLYAVMNLFQNSETLEGFERSLNDPESMINNLDLNRDNYVDYIMVFDYKEGSVHHIVLRVALNQNEYQDVAVFTVQKFQNGSVQVQLIGDEALYGPNYIIEPVYAETPNPGYRGNVAQQTSAPRQNVTVVHTTQYEVAYWPVITYIYRPSYRVYRSSWRWGYHPSWWSPWSPHYYHYYYGYHYNWHAHYYAYYRPWGHPRSTYYTTVYRPRIRNYSPTVVVNINRGTYKDTYSRPESRREGEVLYAHRHSSGSTVAPGRGRENVEQGRQGARTSSGTTTREAGVENTRRTTTQSSETRSSAATRQNAAPQRTQSERPANTGTRVDSRNAERGAAVRSEAAPQRQSAATPARNATTRPANTPQRSTPNTGSAPARVNNNNNRPAAQSAPAVRTQPARNSNQPATQARPSSQTNTRNSGTSVQRNTSAPRNTGTSVQRNSNSNTRNSGTSVQRTTSNNRNSGTSVQRSSGNNRSTGTSVQRSSSNTRSSSPATNSSSRNQRR